MDEFKRYERIMANSIRIGCIRTLAEEGKIKENLTEKQAFAKYGKAQVIAWREKEWVTAYPSGNKVRAKFYYKRSELETAKLMINNYSLIRQNRIEQLIELEQ